MDRPVVEVFAYQETLLVMMIFGVAILAMIWAGFRRWLQYKEKVGRLIAEETAERVAQYGAQMVHVEARLKDVEKSLRDGSVKKAAQIDAPRSDPLPNDPIVKRDEV